LRRFLNFGMPTETRQKWKMIPSNDVVDKSELIKLCLDEGNVHLASYQTNRMQRMNLSKRHLQVWKPQH